MTSPVIIVGSGVIGLTIAYYLKQLPNPPDVTIIARELPKLPGNDDDDWVNGSWASPWAGAIFAADENPVDENVHKIESESYRFFWKIASNDPSSGVELRLIRQYYDDISVPDASKLKIHLFTHKYRQLREHELPVPRRRITGGIEYMSMCINPWIYLPWLRSKLEDSGVSFINDTLNSLEEATKYLRSSSKSPIIINATGLGSKHLKNVDDSSVQSVRGQTMWVHCDYNGPMAIRSGHEYTYVIPRAFSQGVIFGGVSQPENESTVVDNAIKDDIITRVRDLVPDAYSSALTIPDNTTLVNYKGLRIIKDIVGFRPGRVGGPRIELDGNRSIPIIHAYGFEGHGYISSGGTAKKVLDFILEIESKKSSRL